MQRSLYDVLEVAPLASPETIEAAYRSLIRRYHPDKVASLGTDLQALAAERAKEINSAYNILRDGGQRAAYDEQLRAARRSSEGRPVKQGHRVTSVETPRPNGHTSNEEHAAARDATNHPRATFAHFRESAEQTAYTVLSRYRTMSATYRKFKETIAENTKMGRRHLGEVLAFVVLFFIVASACQYFKVRIPLLVFLFVFGPYAIVRAITGTSLLISGSLVTLMEISRDVGKTLLVVRTSATLLVIYGTFRVLEFLVAAGLADGVFDWRNYSPDRWHHTVFDALILIIPLAFGLAVGLSCVVPRWVLRWTP